MHGSPQNFSFQKASGLTCGTHVVAQRRGYAHHGIYVGNGRVIHYAGRFSHAQGRVEEVSLARFCKGRRLRVVVGERRKFEADEVVRRARSRLGEHRYRLLSNNCEHFCSWCLAGEPRSEQVEQWLTLPRRLCSALVQGLIRGLSRVSTRRISGAAGRQAFAFCSSFRSFNTASE